MAASAKQMQRLLDKPFIVALIMTLCRKPARALSTAPYRVHKGSFEGLRA